MVLLLNQQDRPNLMSEKLSNKKSLWRDAWGLPGKAKQKRAQRYTMDGWGWEHKRLNWGVVRGNIKKNDCEVCALPEQKTSTNQ